MKTTNWNDNTKQYPRLLSEVSAIISNKDIREIAENMDLSEQEIWELFDRAEADFRIIKNHLINN